MYLDPGKQGTPALEILSDVHSALFYGSACVALLTTHITSLNWTGLVVPAELEKAWTSSKYSILDVPLWQ